MFWHLHSPKGRLSLRAGIRCIRVTSDSNLPPPGPRHKASMDGRQVAASEKGDKEGSSGARLSGNLKARVVEQEGELQDFFGQLWWFPSSPPPRVCVQTNLF
jgi:hypothetical protein